MEMLKMLDTMKKMTKCFPLPSSDNSGRMSSPPKKSAQGPFVRKGIFPNNIYIMYKYNFNKMYYVFVI